MRRSSRHRLFSPSTSFRVMNLWRGALYAASFLLVFSQVSAAQNCVEFPGCPSGSCYTPQQCFPLPAGPSFWLDPTGGRLAGPAHGPEPSQYLRGGPSHKQPSELLRGQPAE
jgi:hypothetical protein